MQSYSYQRSDAEYPETNYAYSPSAIRYYAKYYPKSKCSNVDQNVSARNVHYQQPLYPESSAYNATYTNMMPNNNVPSKQQQINQNVSAATPVTYQTASSVPLDSVCYYIPVIYTRKIIPRYTVRPVQNQSIAIQAEQNTPNQSKYEKFKKSISRRISEESILSDASEHEQMNSYATKISKTTSKASSLFSLRSKEPKRTLKSTSIFDEMLSLKKESQSKTISTIYKAEKEMLYESQSTQTQWTQTSTDLTMSDEISSVSQHKPNSPPAKISKPFYSVIFSYIMRMLLLFPTSSFYSFLRQLVFIY